MFYLAIFQRYAVGNTHQSADGDHLVAFQQRPHRIFQGISLKHRIGVHTDKIRETGGVDAHVQRISLAAVFLDDQSHANAMDFPFVDCFLFLARHLTTDWALGFD